jgi:hypothetical protein
MLGRGRSPRRLGWRFLAARPATLGPLHGPKRLKHLLRGPGRQARTVRRADLVTGWMLRLGRRGRDPKGMPALAPGDRLRGRATGLRELPFPPGGRSAVLGIPASASLEGFPQLKGPQSRWATSPARVLGPILLTLDQLQHVIAADTSVAGGEAAGDRQQAQPDPPVHGRPMDADQARCLAGREQLVLCQYPERSLHCFLRVSRLL